jgi:hypothetical protein
MIMNEIKVIDQIKKHDYAAFKEVCMEFSKPLNSLAYTLVGNFDQAHQIVNQIFITLWINNFSDPVTRPLQDFLESQVKQACTNFKSTRTSEIKKRRSHHSNQSCGNINPMMISSKQ